MSTVADVRKAIEDDGEKLTGDIYSDFRKQTDATIDQWLANNYESLKDYKYLGPVARNAMVSLNEANNKEGEGKPQSLLAKYGLSPDYRAPNHWGNLSKTQLERLARESKYKDYEAFKQALWDESKAFEREKVWQDFRQEHPIINFIAESFFPNTYEGTKRIVESGEGEKSDLYDDAILDFALGVGSSVNPITKFSKSGVLVKALKQGAYSAIFSSANEMSQMYNYDKDFSPSAVLTGTVLGAGSEFNLAKKGSNMLKSLFPENPSVKKLANSVDNVVGDVRAQANDYVHNAEKKLKTYGDPKNNPASKDFKRTSENALNEGVTADDAKKAKEAMELYTLINDKVKPDRNVTFLNPKTGRVHTIFMKASDDEIAQMFMRHEPLNKLDVSNHPPKFEIKKPGTWVSPGLKYGVPLYQTGRTGAVGKINAARTLEQDAKATERKAVQKSEDQALIAKWKSGYAPTSGADKDMPAFTLWGKKHPKEWAKALAATKKRKDKDKKNAEEFFDIGSYNDVYYAGF